MSKNKEDDFDDLKNEHRNNNWEEIDEGKQSKWPFGGLGRNSAPPKPDPEWEEFCRKNKSEKARAMFLAKRLLKKEGKK